MEFAHVLLALVAEAVRGLGLLAGLGASFGLELLEAVPDEGALAAGG